MIRSMNGIALAGIAAATLALAACGKGESPTSPPTPSTSPGTSATTPPPSSSASTSPAPGAASSSPSSSASASPAPTAAASASPSGNAAAAAAGPGASASAPGAAVTTASAGGGEDTYNKTCMACHAAGVAGAPKIGDKADWGPRVAQGKQVLYDHAIKGFTGQKGAMPPKGGAAQLSDDEVKAAVDYMVSKAS
jgi:cytochrome c5